MPIDCRIGGIRTHKVKDQRILSAPRMPFRHYPKNKLYLGIEPKTLLFTGVASAVKNI